MLLSSSSHVMNSEQRSWHSFIYNVLIGVHDKSLLVLWKQNIFVYNFMQLRFVQSYAKHESKLHAYCKQTVALLDLGNLPTSLQTISWLQAWKWPYRVILRLVYLNKSINPLNQKRLVMDSYNCITMSRYGYIACGHIWYLSQTRNKSYVMNSPFEGWAYLAS